LNLKDDGWQSESHAPSDTLDLLLTVLDWEHFLMLSALDVIQRRYRLDTARIRYQELVRILKQVKMSDLVYQVPPDVVSPILAPGVTCLSESVHKGAKSWAEGFSTASEILGISPQMWEASSEEQKRAYNLVADALTGRGTGVGHLCRLVNTRQHTNEEAYTRYAIDVAAAIASVPHPPSLGKKNRELDIIEQFWV